jgi:hypothetical protein
MLYSPSRRLALAHFPKTAGTSLTNWFTRSFPDFVTPDPNDPHVQVLPSLRRLGLLPKPPRSRWRRLLSNVLTRGRPGRLAEGFLIIGVLRDPFEMLVSLYAYWRRRATVQPRPPGSLAHTAATRSFRDFVVEAVVRQRLPNYHQFFGVGSVAWRHTKLLDFRSLETSLRRVCEEHGIHVPIELPTANVAPQRHDLAGFHEEVSDLLPDLHARFRWYYEEADRIMVKAEPPTTRRAAA